MRVTARLSSPRAKTPTTRCGACSPPSGHGTAARLDRHELEAAAVDGAGAAEAEEPVLERELRAVVGRVRVAAGGVRLPDLDHAVGDRLAGAVEERAADPDRSRVGRVDDAAA